MTLKSYLFRGYVADSKIFVSDDDILVRNLSSYIPSLIFDTGRYSPLKYKLLVENGKVYIRFIDLDQSKFFRGKRWFLKFYIKHRGFGDMSLSQLSATGVLNDAYVTVRTERGF